jgi:hypothetical protein
MKQVVDARAGPGIKSLTKFKAKNKKKLKDVPEKFDKILKKKHVYLKNDREREQSPAMSDDLTGLDLHFEQINFYMKILVGRQRC